MQIYVVDSLDRERIVKAKAEFQVGCGRQFVYANALVGLISFTLCLLISSFRPSFEIHLCSTVSSWFLLTNRTWYVVFVDFLFC